MENYQIGCDYGISQETLDIVEELSKDLEINQSFRNAVKSCPVCHANIADRNIALYKELIDALYQVYVWCGKNRRHEFETKDIVQFLGKSNYARFGDLVRFGGIIYKPKDENGEARKAWFGINMKRAKEFFAGEREIPAHITINQINNEIIDSHYVKIGDFPKLYKLIKANGLYDYETLF